MAHQHAPSGIGGPGRPVGGAGRQIPIGGQQVQAGGTQPAGGSQPAGGIAATSGSPATQGPTGGSQPAGRTPAQGAQTQGVQPGGAAQVTPQRGPGSTVDDALTGSTRVALHDTIKALRVCEWCADQCVDEGPEMARCIRLCRDVADLAELNAEFLVRDSIFGPDLARTFAEAAEECARECSQHAHEHCQECAEVLPRAARTIRELVGTVGSQPQALPAGTQ